MNGFARCVDRPGANRAFPALAHLIPAPYPVFALFRARMSPIIGPGLSPARAVAVLLALGCADFPARAEGLSPEFGGYAETVQGAAFVDDLDSLTAFNFAQVRLRARSQPLEALTLDLEARNRLYFGESARLARPGLQASAAGAGTGSDPSPDAGYLDLSIAPLDEAGASWLLAFDRAWAEWRGEAFTLTAGRQRINWGMTLAWNPNDLFNAYDFLDFLYAERPGSDAVRLRLHPGWPVSFDFAAKADADGRATGALRAAWNRWETDFQVLGGWRRGDIALGGGWAGNLGQAGWKGEAAAFVPADGSGPRSFEVTVTADYALPGGTYLAGSALFNSRGGEEAGFAGGDPGASGFAGAGPDGGGGAGASSTENLFPARWAVLAQASRSFSLILSGTAVLLYAPDIGLIGFLPSMTRSLSNEWELEGLAQIFVRHGDGWDGRRGGGWRSAGNAGYLRLRRSF